MVALVDEVQSFLLSTGGSRSTRVHPRRGGGAKNLIDFLLVIKIKVVQKDNMFPCKWHPKF